MYPITIHVKEEDLAAWHRLASLYHSKGSSILAMLEEPQGETTIMTETGIEKVPGLYEQVSKTCSCGTCWVGLARSDRVQWNPIRRVTGTPGWVNSKHGKFFIPSECALYKEKLLSGYIFEPTPSKKDLTNLNRARTEQALKEIELQEKRDNYERERMAIDLADSTKRAEEERQTSKAKAERRKEQEKEKKEIVKIKKEQVVDEKTKKVIENNKTYFSLIERRNAVTKTQTHYTVNCPKHGLLKEGNVDTGEYSSDKPARNLALAVQCTKNCKRVLVKRYEMIHTPTCPIDDYNKLEEEVKIARSQLSVKDYTI